METSTFMVLGTIREDADLAEMVAQIPDELAEIDRLRTAGLMGAAHVSDARRTVFIEIFAGDEAAARETVLSLPLLRYFDLDMYATRPPGYPPEGAVDVP